MGIGTILAWGSWIVILFQVSPAEGGIAGLAMFYATLAISLIGTITIIGTLIRIFLLKRRIHALEIRTSFRHAVLFSVVSIVSLMLSAAESFETYHIIILIAVASVIEYFFTQFQRKRHS